MTALVLLVLLGAFGSASAAEPVDFAEEIRPLFEEHCYECHGADERKGGLRLTNRRDAFLPGDLGVPVIEPGHADLSPLFELVTSEDKEERMPKEGPPLSPEQIGVLRQWIDQGAAWPAGGDPASTHWAYQPPARPVVPDVRSSDWPRNEIDHFVLARLEAAGLLPSSPAEPARLLRRLHLDLTGLPPTLEEVEAFVADPSPEAYGHVVEDLLSRPAYGERWAVHWLDLARYADSNGFQTDRIYEAWPYRDWVIDAFNEDLPFDRFTVQQVAGDLLPHAGLAERIATGFHRSATTNIEAGADPEEDRVRQVVDRVNVTSTVWLGSTLECAQCHNHKYDPFSQTEFYELFAFFNNTPLEVQPMGEGMIAYVLKAPNLKIPLSPEKKARTTRLSARIRNQSTALAAGTLGPDFQSWQQEMREALATPVEWTPAEVTGFVSSEDEPHRVREGGSLQVEGPVPDAVTHELRVRPARHAITALRIELLPRAPDQPHRPGAKRRPPIVSELRVSPRSNLGESPPLPLFVPTWAKRSALAIDGHISSGWRARGRRNREQAVFLTEDPLRNVSELALVIEQQFGSGATIDRIRISTTDAPTSLVELPKHVVDLLGRDVLGEEDTAKLRAFHDQHGRLAHTEIPRLRRERNRIRQPHARGLEETTPRKSHVLKRGDFLDPGAEVRPATPKVLHPFDEDLPRNRLGLARWLVDPANPLVARVTVNRFWQELFGRGLVRTPEDFGTRGEPPTHPDLIDWLAVEFVEQGWSVKSLLRQIVSSATYRQSSGALPSLQERDPSNVLLARQERRRLPAELIRDNGLAVSGLLNPDRGGPPVYPPQPPGLWRHDGGFGARYHANRDDARLKRGVYVVWRRTAPYPSFVAFDAPDRTTCTVRRATTNTPLQALTLMNDQAWVEMSAALAGRILREAGDQPTDGRIEYGLRLAVAREPRAKEVEELRGLLGRSRRHFEEDPGAAERLLRSARFPADGGLDPIELAAWFSVAEVLLNLDETLSRS